ncbi:MAG: copper chaperone PCu(A)C [Gallionella sp.]|nr:copper chaperone PCu(A)C [Gallionella sp.]
MKKVTQILGTAALMFAFTCAQADDVTVQNAWSRATAPGQNAAMADMTITSQQSAVLSGFACKVCAVAELHSMTHENGVMKMREVKSIELPAGKAVNLAEGGYHLMLLGLKKPLQAGENVPLTLNITTGKKTRKIDVQVEIRPLVDVQSQAGHAGHMHHH